MTVSIMVNMILVVLDLTWSYCFPLHVLTSTSFLQFSILQHFIINIVFVENAFGNYRDVLREVTNSPMMAENLSYLHSKSGGYIRETQGVYAFADENYARYGQTNSFFTIA